MKHEPSDSSGRIDRRTFLQTTAATGLALGGVSTASAQSGTEVGKLRLFSEESVNGSLEVDLQGDYAYVATGDGMAVVDWSNPLQPNTVADVTVEPSARGSLDVKVDGNVASLASNSGTGITLFDVSDPSNPVKTAFYDAGDGVHNNYLAGGYAYLTVNESGESAFSEARNEIVDVSDPTNPVKVGEYRLNEHFPDYANGMVSPLHDVYVQDGIAYQAFWDAGIVVADVSDPSDPQTLSHFGAADGANETPDEFPLERYLTKGGNAHYVQPSPDGQHVYVGAETFPGVFVENPTTEDYGGVKIFDVSDYDNPTQVGYVSPPDVDAFRTSHNFDVTDNRLHASWYSGGVGVYDITDPSSPTTLARYDADGTSFWGARAARGFTVGSDIGGGLVFLSNDRGERRPPSFDGDSSPSEPSLMPDE